ncbi:hypothetical protein BH18ACT7_BH18ACT7_25300 [soil metagenome]|jgi:hypothetical protein
MRKPGSTVENKDGKWQVFPKHSEKEYIIGKVQVQNNMQRFVRRLMVV